MRGHPQEPGPAVFASHSAAAVGVTPVASDTVETPTWGPDGAVVEFIDADSALVSFRRGRSGCVDYYVNGRREVCNVDCYASGLTLHLREATPSGAWAGPTRSTARTTAPAAGGNAIVQRVLALFQTQGKEAAGRPGPEEPAPHAGLDCSVPRHAVADSAGSGAELWEDALASPSPELLSPQEEIGEGAGFRPTGTRVTFASETPVRHELIPRRLADTFFKIDDPDQEGDKDSHEAGHPATIDPGELANILANADTGARRKRLVASKRPARTAPLEPAATTPVSASRAAAAGGIEEADAAPLWPASLAARLAAPIASALRRVSR